MDLVPIPTIGSPLIPSLYELIQSNIYKFDVCVNSSINYRVGAVLVCAEEAESLSAATAFVTTSMIQSTAAEDGDFTTRRTAIPSAIVRGVNFLSQGLVTFASPFSRKALVQWVMC